MEISLNIIIDYLDKYQPSSNTRYDTVLSVINIKPITQEEDIFKKDTIYVGYLSQLPDNITSGSKFICINDKQAASSNSYYPEAIVILLEASVAPDHIINCMQNMIEERHFLDFCASQLLLSLFEDKSIQQIIDKSYEFFGNPIYLVDNHFNSIAFSKNQIDNTIWNDMKTKGIISDEGISLLKNQNVFKTEIQHEKPYFSGSAGSGDLDFRRLVSLVKINKKKVATIVVWESNKPFRKIDLEIAELLSNVISIKLKNSLNIPFAKSLVLENFFRDILNGKVSDNEIIIDTLSSLNWVIKDNLYIITADTIEFDDTKITQEFLCSKLEELINGSYAFTYNNYIILLVSRSGKDMISTEEFGSLETFCSQYKIYAGVSKLFRGYENMRKHFKQSVEALSMGRKVDKKKALFHFQDYMVNYIIDIIKKQRLLKDFCHPALLELVKYDNENNTQYACTLLQYLNNERNIAHTSYVMHIHRNTLLYRLEKIRKIIKCNLDDSEVRLQLLLSYKFLELAYENTEANEKGLL